MKSCQETFFAVRKLKFGCVYAEVPASVGATQPRRLPFQAMFDSRWPDRVEKRKLSGTRSQA